VDQTLEQILIRLYQSESEVERLRAEVARLTDALSKATAELQKAKEPCPVSQ